jgi:uncharacterized membrane protein
MDAFFKYILQFTTNPKVNSRIVTSFIILGLVFSYAYVFFNVIVLSSILSNLILIGLFFLIKALIADWDNLYSGNPEKNRFVKAFQAHIPSDYILKKFRTSLDSHVIFFS